VTNFDNFKAVIGQKLKNIGPQNLKYEEHIKKGRVNTSH
jgi:hypothetical protein